MKRANIHLHTGCSDGELSPEQVLRKAKAYNLSAISFTDHDTVKAYEIFLPNQEHFGVELISGVELSASYQDMEVHILGYFIDVNSSLLKEFLSYRQARREERLRKIILSLQTQKIDIRYEEVVMRAKSSCSIGRPHIATILIEKGYVFSFKEAFNKYIGCSCEAYCPTENATLEEAIGVIEASGGVSVIAHPGKMISKDTFDKLVELGVRGVEVVHPSHDPKQVKIYQHLACENYLLMTGGSDFHGSKPNDDSNFSQYTISYDWVEKMKLWIGA